MAVIEIARRLGTQTSRTVVQSVSDRGGRRFFVGEYLLIEKNKREGNIGRIRAEYNERVGAFRVSSNSAELVSTRGVSQYLTIYG